MARHVMSNQERQLCEFLKDHPLSYKNRYTENAERALLHAMFWSLAGGSQDYFNLFFSTNPPQMSDPFDPAHSSSARHCFGKTTASQTTCPCPVDLCQMTIAEREAGSVAEAQEKRAILR